MAIHQSSCPLGILFMLQHTFYPEVSKPRQLHHPFTGYHTVLVFHTLPSTKTFSVSDHQINTVKSIELATATSNLLDASSNLLSSTGLLRYIYKKINAKKKKSNHSVSLRLTVKLMRS